MDNKNSIEELNNKIKNLKDIISGKADIDIPLPEDMQKIIDDVKSVLTDDTINKCVEIIKNTKNNNNKDEN